MSSTLKLPDKEIIEDIAIELGILPSFIEKDFYAVQLLSELSKFHYENTNLIFTGGTCLSKGYNLIKRFSEDIDFRIQTETEFGRKERKDYREFIINKLSQVGYIDVLTDTLEKGNKSKFFSFYIKYPKRFELDKSLRANLKLEFTFEEVVLPTIKCDIKPLLSNYVDSYAKTNLSCVSPVEIAANKFSALLWRIDIKDRSKTLGEPENDPTIIRHLHDLSALENYVLCDDFVNSIMKSFNADKGRGGSNKDLSLIEFAEKTLYKFKNDTIYSKEYKDFVDALSYAQDSETIDFSSALTSFERISHFIKKKY